MTTRTADLDKLRAALRRMSRGNLLTIAERSIELVPPAKLQALVGRPLKIEYLADTKPGVVPLLGEVRKFHEKSLHGVYYESFAVNSGNFMEESGETAEFIVEFNRLLGRCIRAAKKGPRASVREAFELLFGLLRHIDEGHDDVIFFADEGGSWKVGVNWRAALPAYFECLAGASPEDFAREVDRSIEEFAAYERPRHLTAARRVASAGQKAALRALPNCLSRTKRLT